MLVRRHTHLAASVAHRILHPPDHLIRLASADLSLEAFQESHFYKLFPACSSYDIAASLSDGPHLFSVVHILFLLLILRFSCHHSFGYISGFNFLSSIFFSGRLNSLECSTKLSHSTLLSESKLFAQFSDHSPCCFAAMVRFQTVASTVLGLAAAVYAAPQQTTPSVNIPPASASATATATSTDTPKATAACALAASRQAAYFSAFPSGELNAVLRP